MTQLSKNPVESQPAGYPVVSYRLQLLIGARRDARRRRVPADGAIAAVNATYRDTHGNRYATRRAGWQAVDSQVSAGAGEGA